MATWKYNPSKERETMTKSFMQVGKSRWVDVKEIYCINTTEDDPAVIQGYLRSPHKAEYVVIEEQYLPSVLEVLMGTSKKAEMHTLSKEDVFEANAVFFEECSICAAKTGTPILCRSCLVNRKSIMFLKEMLT